MAVKTLTDLDSAMGWKAPGNATDLFDVLQQLQGLKQTVIAGGAAGNHTVTGIATTDHLIGVNHLVGDGTQLTGAANNLTSEFTISAANTIDNTGGTATTNGVLIVTYFDTTGA